MQAHHAAPEQAHRGEAAEVDGHAAEHEVDHREERDEREHARRDHALVERAHDVVVGAELDEVGADDRGHHAGAADGERQHHAGELEVRRERDGREHHGGNGRHHIGLEQVGRHAGAIADVVTDVVGDGGGVARIIFRDARFDLAHHVAADVRTLGEDAAAETGEDRDQRGAEGQGHQRVDDGAARRVEAHRVLEEAEVEGDAEEAQARDEKARDRARLEGEVEAARERLGGRLRHAHIGAHRDVHADEAGETREHGADGEADGRPDAEQQPGEDEDHHADDADGGVLTVEIGRGAFAHGGGNLLHTGRAGVSGHKAARRHDAVHDGERACEHDQPECSGHDKPLCLFSVSPEPLSAEELRPYPCPGRWCPYAKSRP